MKNRMKALVIGLAILPLLIASLGAQAPVQEPASDRGAEKPAAAKPTPAAPIPAKAPTSPAAVEGLTVAVFDFQANDSELRETGVLLAELARVRLTAQGKLRLVTRQDMQKILEEQKLGLTGLTGDTAPRVGNLLGAQVVVLGNVFAVNGRLIATARVIGVETSRVYGEKVEGEKAGMEKMGEELGNKIAGAVEKGADTLVAKVKLSKDQIAEIRKKVGDKNLPRVYVQVSEQVLGTAAPDPAAQTEIQYILRKIGCEVVKDRSGDLSNWAKGYAAKGGKTSPPALDSVDIILIGEAFSQFASRTGDLISSRSRVEVEAIDVKTGKVLATDRQTHVAVDLAEQIAAKTALQEGAAKLASRLIPEAVSGWRKGKSEK
jgi:hypothetical protein